MRHIRCQTWVGICLAYGGHFVLHFETPWPYPPPQLCHWHMPGICQWHPVCKVCVNGYVKCNGICQAFFLRTNSDPFGLEICQAYAKVAHTPQKGALGGRLADGICLAFMVDCSGSKYARHMPNGHLGRIGIFCGAKICQAFRVAYANGNGHAVGICLAYAKPQDNMPKTGYARHISRYARHMPKIGARFGRI